MSVEAIARRLASAQRDPGLAPEGKWAAVALLLRDGPEGPELFFIRRAEHPKDPWSGHVAFPGGRKDPEDASLLATAIRETAEEVGLVLRSEQVLVRLPEVDASLRSKRTLTVAPFVFHLREAQDPKPNDEVATTLWVPLSVLVRDRGKASFTFTYGNQSFDAPCIYLEPGNHRLWGLSYRMLEHLLDVLG